MRALTGFFAAVATLFLVLNTFGGIVSGIWLAALGEWWSLALGILLVPTAPFLISILLLPILALGAGAMAVADRSRIGLLFFGFLSSAYVAFAITAWCVGLLLLFTSRATENNWLPLLIWSYGAATGPWSYMAAKEAQSGGAEGSVAAALFAQFAYLATVLTGMFIDNRYSTLISVFGGVMLINVAMQFAIVLTADQSSNYSKPSAVLT